MKTVTKNILIVCAAVIFACAIIFVPMLYSHISADVVTYKLGSATVQSERLETENATVDGRVSGPSSSSTHFVSGGKILELSSGGGSATYTVKMAQAGNYVVKCAYFTNSTGTALKVSVNGGEAVTTDTLLRTGGWASTTKILCRYVHVPVALNAGENTIVIKQAPIASGANYVNLDFIEIYPADSVYYYETEKNGNPTVAGAFSLNERIEAEYGYNLSESGVSQIESSGNCISGWLMKLNSSALQYAVEVEEAGDYYLQIVNSSTGAFGATQQMKYNFTVNGTACSFTEFPLATYQGGGNVVQSAAYFEVTLKKGINLIVLNSIESTNDTRTDFFTVFTKDSGLERVLELERYAYGLAKVIKSENDYPEISGEVVEFSTQAMSTIKVPVTVSEAGAYDLYLRGWTGTANAKVTLTLNGVAQDLTVGQTGWVTSSGLQKPKDNIYRIQLQAGANELVFTQSGSIYVDMDWIYLSKERVSQEPNELGGFALSVGDEMQVGTGVTVADESLATVQNGVLKAVKAGKTLIQATVTMDNGYSYVRSYPLTVEKIAYTGGGLVAPDMTVQYNGEPIYYSGASAPQDWRITYSNNDEPIKGIGEKSIAVKFSHDVYKDVIMEATLTVTKADYAGADLLAEDVSGFYNGSVYAVAPTAPQGWEITTSGNGRKAVGESTVRVAFTHPYYNDVVKSATIRVGYVAQGIRADVDAEHGLVIAFAFAIEDEVFADATAKIVIRTGTEQTELALSAGVEQNGVCVFTHSVSPRDYQKVFYARVETALGICPEIGVSVASYVDGILSNETDAERIAFATALRDYCIAVKDYLGYLPATEAHTSVTAQMLEPFRMKTDGTLPSDVKISGVKVVFEGELKLRLYFTATSTKVEGAAQDGKNTYYVEQGVSMSKLGEEQSFTLGGCTVKCSALTYAESVLSNSASSVALKNLARAMYNYYNATKA